MLKRFFDTLRPTERKSKQSNVNRYPIATSMTSMVNDLELTRDQEYKLIINYLIRKLCCQWNKMYQFESAIIDIIVNYSNEYIPPYSKCFFNNTKYSLCKNDLQLPLDHDVSDQPSSTSNSTQCTDDIFNINSFVFGSHPELQ